MKIIIQRVKSAGVIIDKKEKKSIEKGIVVFLGVSKDDKSDVIQWMTDKTLNLRIFPDENGKFDRSILEIKGDILIVSQFTLYADCKKGRRPDFTQAAKPEVAIPLYEKFIESVKRSGLNVETGDFGSDMLVEIHNDGPVTIEINSN